MLPIVALSKTRHTWSIDHYLFVSHHRVDFGLINVGTLYALCGKAKKKSIFLTEIVPSAKN